MASKHGEYHRGHEDAMNHKEYDDGSDFVGSILTIGLAGGPRSNSDSYKDGYKDGKEDRKR